MPTGTVKFFNPSKGFGFITYIQDSGKDSGKKTDIYFHSSAIKQKTILEPDEEVSFEIEKYTRGERAVNVNAL